MLRIGRSLPARSRAPLAWAAFAAAASIALAACGGTAASSGAAAPAASGVVALEAREYAFTPSAVTVPAGAVTFSVTNAGTQEHEFEIFQGDKLVDEVEGIVPGLTKTATMTLAAGDYTFMCKLNGHDQLGMKGTITVTGS
ncbi:MAG TPA: cupredoxin domain-containing protein [Candidatus Limnocylindrales bacterium]|jgi:iron uptake system component EfeO|nr:cupredoxin domain-containing protein [Candidatus Limnocylindrales bacterium]